jgi:hypothetical protein
MRLKTKSVLGALVGVATLTMLPASAEQSLLDCNKAISTYTAVTDFDRNAVEKGQWICLTPVLMARDEMQTACSKVRK